MVEPVDITWIYALALQASGVIVLVYCVALLGTRLFPPPGGEHRRKSRAGTR